MSCAADSMSIHEIQNGTSSKTAAGPYNYKILVAIFIIFVLVQSHIFVDSVIAPFHGCTVGRDVTETGVIIQGICVVLLYIVFNCLITSDLI